MFFRLSAVMLCFIAICTAAPPPLTPRDTKVKIEEILHAHATYQKLTPELIQRALQNYIDELDPGKTYFIENEIVKWTQASPDLLKKTMQGYKDEDFTSFEEIHAQMLLAIERRGSLEQSLAGASLPTGVQPTEFKDISWAKTEAELSERLLRIKALQIEAADKINQETRSQFLQRLAKRRTIREEELSGRNLNERKQMILALVLKATSSALDSQTLYFTPTEASQFMIQVQQRLFGIGAQLRDDLNGLTIVRLLDGGPASVGNKLHIGDRIIAVDGEPIVGMDITDAVQLIRGQQGTKIHLTVLRMKGEMDNKQEEKLEIELVRGEVVLKESRFEKSYEPFGDGTIGYLHLFSFYQDANSSSAKDLQEAIEELKKAHNLKGIILDLRNNGGGLMQQAVAVTGLFIKKGIVVSVKDNTSFVQRLRNIDSKIAWDGPLIVLINRASASAAEIVSQTLQDYGRAILIGDAQTFGKGTFQTFTLEAANFGKVNPKGEYKVTRGRYYTVSGKSPQLMGVQADIIVPGILSELDVGEKFSKFPLENDQILPCFDDDLSDIPPHHRSQIERLYKFDLQPILTTYQPYLPLLRSNSTTRVQNNQNYQNFLKELRKKEFIADPTEIYGQTDLQLDETMKIMKDLLLLMQQQMIAQKAAAA